MTVQAQIDKICEDAFGEICWAESYEECFEILEKGKQRVAALLAENP